MKTIFVDFNNRDSGGFLRLNNYGTLDDLGRLSISLVDGFHFIGSDGDLQAEVIAREPGLEGVWRGEILMHTLVDQL
jgi:hypothetical protein